MPPMRVTRISAAVFVLVCCVVARGEGRRILVVDPGDSETGRSCERTLSELPGAPAVRRIDLAHIGAAGDECWDGVVGLRPEPSLYAGASEQLWRRITGDPKTGLL